MASNVSELETEPKSAYFQRPSPTFLLPPPPHIGFPFRSSMIPQNDLSSDVETLTRLNSLWKDTAGDHRFKLTASVQHLSHWIRSVQQKQMHNLRMIEGCQVFTWPSNNIIK